jgi:hypothetical protein
MMISDEQARLAANLLKTSCDVHSRMAVNDVPQEVIDAAREAASQAPDLRDDRVQEARERLAHGDLDPHAVASMMLGRIIGDALR